MILVAELDRSQLPKAKFDFDAVGHYARPDIFRLLVDNEPKPAVLKTNAMARSQTVSAGGRRATSFLQSRTK
jgi:nitrilase